MYMEIQTSPVGYAPDGTRRRKAGQKTRRVWREPKKYRRKLMGISKYIIGYPIMRI